MRTLDLLIIGAIIITLAFELSTRFNNIEEQNIGIMDNQNSIILLLSKDYPDIEIQKIKKSKARIKKLKELEEEIQKLFGD